MGGGGSGTIITTESGLTYSESGYNPSGSLRQTTSANILQNRGSYPQTTLAGLSGTGSIISSSNNQNVLIPQRTTMTSSSSIPMHTHHD